ncbi:hypothetical protein SAMN05216436_110141, partial [bacterium A37T11]
RSRFGFYFDDAPKGIQIFNFVGSGIAPQPFLLIETLFLIPLVSFGTAKVEVFSYSAKIIFFYFFRF